MSAASVGLWRRRDFLKLWAGQAVSLLGSQVTLLALPLTAVLLLHASAAQMGLLRAVTSVPALLFGLLAGVVADRVRRRPLLIRANIGRALLLGSIPVAAVLGLLRLGHLFFIAFATGTLTVFFEVAYTAYLPTLVTPPQLVEGNSRLETTRAVAQFAGPGVAGVLIQWLTAPLAIGVHALGFLVSTVFLGTIHTVEPALRARGARASVWREIAEGLRAVQAEPTLRALAGSSAIFNLFDNMLLAVYVLYVTRTLGLPPAAVGGILAVGGLGSLVGALLASRVARAIGLGRTLLGGVVVASLAEGGIALAHGPQVALILALAEAAVQCGALLYTVNNVSLRQALVPGPLRGRVTGTVRFLTWGVAPIGAILGGMVGERYGLRSAVLVAALGTTGACLWLALSPVRAMRAYPASLT